MTIIAKISYEPYEGYESAYDTSGKVEKPITNQTDICILLHKFAMSIGMDVDEVRVYPKKGGVFFSSTELGPQQIERKIH